jgi:hypothetical protein
VRAPADPSAVLAQALRTGATRAARAAGGGVVLVYEAAGSDELRLRAAAGFSAPDQARAAGAALAAQVGEAMLGSGVCEIEINGAGLGARARGGVRVPPGALGIAAPRRARGRLAEVPTAEQIDRVAEIVETIAVHFDHARPRARVRRAAREDGTAADRTAPRRARRCCDCPRRCSRRTSSCCAAPRSSGRSSGSRTTSSRR